MAKNNLKDAVIQAQEALYNVKQLTTLITEQVNQLAEKLDDTWNILLADNLGKKNRLLIIHYNTKGDLLQEVPQLEFKNVCDIVESIFKVKLEKEFSGDYLDANAYLPKYGIHIRQCQIDKCEIEYVEEVTKVAKLTGLCAEVLL